MVICARLENAGPEIKDHGYIMLAMQLMFSQDVYMAHCILRGRMCFLLFNLTISMHSYTEDISKAQPISRFYGRDADREMDGFP